MPCHCPPAHPKMHSITLAHAAPLSHRSYDANIWKLMSLGVSIQVGAWSSDC